jgi:hypothetical protein
VIVTEVPPVVEPEFGDIEVTVGAGPGFGGVPAVVNRQTGPVAVIFAIVLLTMRQ